MLTYRYVRARYDRPNRAVEITVRAPDDLLTMTRELDDLILRLRTNEPELGTWLIRTEGDPGEVLRHEAGTFGRDDWLANEITHYYKRTLKRLDVTSRSLIALIEPGSCFAGFLLELALACDRQYMLAEDGVVITLSDTNFGTFPMGNGLSRLASRFYRAANTPRPCTTSNTERRTSPIGSQSAEFAEGETVETGGTDHLTWLRKHTGRELTAAEATELGLVTEALDDLDWEDEVRIAVEARASLSPDALTGMEANHRFVGPETIETKIFGRLSAWQNWIFNRPNAAGEDGALRRYGTGRKAAFDRKRV
ncbi:hypothetical protein GCM10029964_075150 [Kibdelosporangium lantanae]